MERNTGVNPKVSGLSRYQNIPLQQ